MVDNIHNAQVGDKLTPAQVLEAAGGPKAKTNEIPAGVDSVLEQKDLEYPLNNPDDYKGRLVFNVVKEAETELGNVLGNALEFGKDLVKALADGQNPFSDETANTETPVQVVAGGNQEDQQKATNSHYGNESSSQPVTKRKPLTAVGRKVSLYLPVGLQYRDNVAYENTQLGASGGAMEAGLKSGVGALSSLLETTGKTVSAALTGNASTDMAKLATVKLMGRFPDEVAGAFKSAGQVTTNPNTRVLFKEVGLRDFSFAFKFIATSAKEAEEVKEIIKLFRTELYPENISLEVAGSDISIGYRFPNKFQINVEYDGEEIATRIKPCYLRDVGVTYNNTAMSMHSDGNFQEIEMTLAFQESRTLNRRDVEEDGF